MTTAYVGLGANLGDRAETLQKAVRELNERSGVRVRAVSAIYETAPVGKTDQPSFYNGVVEVETDLSARGLLDLLLEVELLFGRVRIEKWGPRILDLDVLLFGDEIIQEPGLSVPHPYMSERAFVLAPLSELHPDGCHPESQKTFRELAGRVSAGQDVVCVAGLSLLPDC